MKKRILTALVLIALFIPLIILNGWFYTILVAFLSYVAGYELLNMFSKKESIFSRLKYILPCFNVIAIMLAAFSSNYLLTYTIFFVLIIMVLFVLRKNINLNISMRIIFTYMYTGLTFAYIFLLRDPFTGTMINKGLYKLVYLMIAVMFTDIFALTFGMLFGKHKLCPTISPKKTIEGAIGGTIVSVISSTAFYFIISKFQLHNSLLDINSLGYPVLEVLIVVVIGLVLSIISQIGDLFASKLKREYEIKDYGNIFPGHGGVLDRFDSIITAGTMLQIILLFIL